jgi:outer membrane protein OmpA-like peptidoglycan-associated protein
MLRAPSRSHHRRSDEAEKPFWISFADLMTALMVLFLVVMSVALLSVTKTITEQEAAQSQHDDDVSTILKRFQDAAAGFPGIKIDAGRRVIDFGERAQFPLNQSFLSQDQERSLRAFVPEILRLANDDLGRRVLKRIVVEGFTDKTGDYLFNLNLSLARSQRVLCAMFPSRLEDRLTEDQQEQVRALFLVGGYSFNAAKETAAESRRVEMRLEFLGVGEPRRETAESTPVNTGTCALPQ